MPLFLEKTGCLFRPDLSFGGKKEYDLIMQDVPLLTAAGKPIMGTGAGKVVLLHKVVEKVRGAFSNFVQNIGDCVSFGGMGAIMATYCCDIAFRGQSEKWMHDISTEWLYGTSRVLVGKRRLGKGDGSVGAWLAKACVEHGVLFRIKYGDKYDLTKYSGARARDWGYNGLPLELEEQADEHPVSGMNPLVRSYEEARDCIANGYAVYVCSNVGYSDRRDSQGFARRSGTWAHCMYLHGVDDTARPGILQQNSWPENWISGPKRLEQPEGSFWTDAEDIDKQIKSGEAFAIPGLNGFKKTRLNWGLVA